MGVQGRAVAVFRAAVVVGFVGFLLYVIFFTEVGPRNLDEARADVDLLGPWAPVAAVLLQAILVICLLPGWVVIIATSLLFGTASIWISLFGQTLGATACFFLARYVGHDYLRGLLGPRILVLERILQTQGFRYLLYLKFLSVIPVAFVSFTPGLVRMRFRRFLTATVLGEIPFIVVVGFFGDSLADIHQPSDVLEPAFVVPAAFFVALFVVPMAVVLAIRKIRHRAPISLPPSASSVDEPKSPPPTGPS